MYIYKTHTYTHSQTRTHFNSLTNRSLLMKYLNRKTLLTRNKHKLLFSMYLAYIGDKYVKN